MGRTLFFRPGKLALLSFANHNPDRWLERKLSLCLFEAGFSLVSLEEAVAIVNSRAMAFVRDATALARTATLERALHSVRLARGQENASRVKEEDRPGSLPGLIACSPDDK